MTPFNEQISQDTILKNKNEIPVSIKIIQNQEDLNLLAQVYSFDSIDLNDESGYINEIWKSSEGQNRFFIIGLINSKPAGFAAAYYTDICGGTYFLAELYVNSSFRKQGLAEFLVKKVINFSREKGYEVTTTQTEHENIPAQSLYTKIGFKPIINENSKHLTLQIDNNHVNN